MTDDKIALRALLEKGSDTAFLREMIGFAAERLIELLPVWWTPSLGCFLKLEGADGAATVQPGVQAGGSPAG